MARTWRLSVTLSLTIIFFFVEIVVGSMTRSNALVADAFHMLSDVISLVTAILAMRYAKKSSPRNTFGWSRLEVFGALVNGVFLLALCFSLLVTAIERLFLPEPVEDPKLVLIVGAVGLAFNVVGLGLLGSASHGHSHGNAHVAPVEEGTGVAPRKKTDHNMRGAFLHVAGDALGSVVVIISALVIWLTDWSGNVYVDPLLSIIVVCLLLSHTIPLVRTTSRILLQALPSHVQLDELKSRILDVSGVLQVHELHIWQLTDDKIVASAHVACKQSDYARVARELGAIFHELGIHATTMQPEFIDEEEDEDGLVTESQCLLRCRGNVIEGDLPITTAGCSEPVCCDDEQSVFTSGRRSGILTERRAAQGRTDA